MTYNVSSGTLSLETYKGGSLGFHERLDYVPDSEEVWRKR